MRIISKYKDYYDYLQGVYGTDEKLILDRRNGMRGPHIDDKDIITLHIGTLMVQGLCYNGTILYGPEIEPYTDTAEPKYFNDRKTWPSAEYYHLTNLIDAKWKLKHCLKKPKDLGDDSPTWEHNCPILVKRATSDYVHYPKLKDFYLTKILPPEQIWQILSAWLGQHVTRNEPICPIGDDKIRIKSAGFDLKTSFRH